MAISSLSFSRGREIHAHVRLHRQLSQSRGSAPAERGQHGDRDRGAAPRHRGAEPRHRKPVPGRDADLAAKSSSSARTRSTSGLVAGRDQHGRDRDAAVGDRGLGQLARRWRRRAAALSAIDQLAAAADAPAVAKRALLAPPRPWRRGRTPPPRPAAATRPSARSTSMRRDSRARSNRMVSCGSQASVRAGADRQRDVDRRASAPSER